MYMDDPAGLATPQGSLQPPPPTVPLLSQQASLVGVGWRAFWTACLALGRPSPLTMSAVCKAARIGRALKVVFSCRNQTKLCPLLSTRGAQLGGPLFHQVRRESIPPWCFQGKGLPFALLVLLSSLGLG